MDWVPIRTGQIVPAPPEWARCLHCSCFIHWFKLQH
nr:unnamed protein product [Callosobruchus analis]